MPLTATANFEAFTPLMEQARSVRDRANGPVVHLRAVVEFTNTCLRNCNYCGMRASNRSLERYEMRAEAIVAAGRQAKAEGIQRVMIQGGDHLRYDVGELCRAVEILADEFGQTVIVCVGDRPFDDYRSLFGAGAEQAIVKFETGDPALYKRMRPHNTLKARLELIHALAGIGYKVSSGFIYGLPGTTEQDVERDLALIRELPLFAASVSPFVPNDQSPLAGHAMPPLSSVLACISQMRLNGPTLYIPSVSALNLLAKAEGRPEPGQLLGLMAGANGLTINYTPAGNLDSYVIYDTRRAVVDRSFALGIAEQAGMATD